MQKEFNEDKSIDIIIGTDAMSTGLNLTGASYVINYDDFWSPSIMEQRNGRAHRIGQKNNVTVINFVCKDTIEERIRSVLDKKSKTAGEILGDDMETSIISKLGSKDLAKLL
jgi:SNF2 family DNA or RNA helicase